MIKIKMEKKIWQYELEYDIFIILTTLLHILYFFKDLKICVFKLMNDESRYYINRGIESGLSVEELKEVLLGKEVYITYPPHWSFLDPMNTTKHISKLATRNEIFYSEF